jgi:hypothetical protein
MNLVVLVRRIVATNLDATADPLAILEAKPTLVR